MNLVEHYNRLYYASINDIKKDKYVIDPLIDSSTDNRFGLTLLFRTDETINNQIQAFLSHLRNIEPNQYYYPNSDIHVTVLSIISCYSRFNLEQISIDDYRNIIVESLMDCISFEIDFRGITASSSCIMIQGFPSDNSLEKLRDRLRYNFKNSQLQQSIDTRYSINTSHSTVARFRTPFTRKEDYLAVLEEYRNYFFGTLKVKTLEFVYNDWYLRKSSAKLLDAFLI